MDTDFSPAPNKTAVAFLANKKPVSSKIFYKLLPELRARAFTIAGLHGASMLQAARDAVAAIPQGAMTWEESKTAISNQLEPYLGEEGSQAKAELVLRVNDYQAFSTSLYQTSQADDDTTHLQYLHGECKVPTPSHEALNGVILPKDDPFWKTHTGPWGHLGCVCYFRPMNPDLVADEKAADEKRNPDNRNVIEGPSKTALQHGDIIRNGVHYNVSLTGPDNTGFTWHPDDLRIPLKDLAARYDPEVFSEFQTWAQNQKLDDDGPGANRSVWDWLNGNSAATSPVVPVPVPISGPMQSRMDRDDAMQQLAAGVQINSAAGYTVKFGKILHGHFQKTLKENPEDARARFLTAAKAAVQDPVEVWENNHRHYYIARFTRPGSVQVGFVVVAARIGETADEAITFFPKTESELKKFRQGKLLYKK